MGEEEDRLKEYQVIIEDNYDNYIHEKFKSDSVVRKLDWIDIFYGKIRMDLKNLSGSYKFKYTAYQGIEYYIRVIEVVRGVNHGDRKETWLSKVTKETLGSASAGYSNVIIRLDKETADLLHATAIVLEDKVQGLTNNIANPMDQQLLYTRKGLYPPSYETKDDPLGFVYDYSYNRTLESAKFPWLYKHVNIPTEDRIHFNPSKIHPGERFVMIVPTEYVVLPEGKIPDNIFANMWVGIEFSGGYTYKVAGINGKIGIAFRAGALIDDNVPGQIIVFVGGGGHAGIGLGRHGEINFIFILNAPQAQNIAGPSWGFDWDLVFGGLSAKSMTQGSKDAYAVLTEVFKKGEISKILGIGTKNTKYIFNYKTLKKWAQYLYGANKSNIKQKIQDALKNIVSNVQSSGPVYTVKIPSSYLTQFIGIKESAFGTHFFIGAKAEETFVKIIYPEMKPEKLTDWYTYIGQETSTIASNNGSDIQIIDIIDFKKFA